MITLKIRGCAAMHKRSECNRCAMLIALILVALRSAYSGKKNKQQQQRMNNLKYLLHSTDLPLLPSIKLERPYRQLIAFPL